jgi:hypothetical protein
MMKEERPDASLFIGLHKLAERDGEGLVPELYELLAQHRRDEPGDGNVVRLPALASARTTVVPQSEAGKVLPFRR